MIMQTHQLSCPQVKIILLGFLLPLTMLNGVSCSCDYYQNLELGQTYYVYNPGYPNKYRYKNDEDQCTWQMKSPYVMKMNCTIAITSSNGCFEDSLSITFDGEDTKKYCGNETFVVEGMNAIVKLNLSPDSSGGQFLCQVQADKPSDTDNCVCGWQNPARIVGGTEAGINEFPMMAGLVDSRDKMVYCGATIISNQHVLTAAHCIERKDVNVIGVVVGEHDVTTGKETNATKLLRIKKCTIHPKYRNNQNDIAICETIKIIKYSTQVGPACLPFQHHRDSFGGSIVIALGWGLMSFGGAKATKLQKVKLNVITQSKCKHYYQEVTSNNICTYTPGKDSCQMDSGGPVLWRNPTTHNLVLIGITTGGIGCASDEPAIEERVGAYVNWIESETRVGYCKVE